jgi:hypothetical protein
MVKATVCLLGANVGLGSFSAEAENSARPPTSASPQKLTSGPNEELVAMGQRETLAPLLIQTRVFP